MFGLRFRSGSRRSPKAQEFDLADKEKFEFVKNGYVPDECPIPLDDYIHIAKCFSDTAGSFCFEKAFAFISDYKSGNFGPPITPSNVYVQVFDLLEQIANCDRKYYILSYLENTEVAHRRPLKLSYMALFKTANILQKKFQMKKVWKIVRFLSEVKRYVKCRVCSVNLYMHISKIGDDSDINWRDILERIEGMIKHLMSDCKKDDEPEAPVDHWDTDSDVEDLNATLDFLPVHEMLEQTRLEDIRNKFDKVFKKKDGSFKIMLERNRQYFRQYHSEKAEILKKKREKQLEDQQIEEEERTKRERKESVRYDKEQQERKSCQKHFRDKYREIDGKNIVKSQKHVFLLTPRELADLKSTKNHVDSTNNSVHGTGSVSSVELEMDIDWKIKSKPLYINQENISYDDNLTKSVSDSFDSRSTINSMWSDVSTAPSKESVSVMSINSFSEVQRLNSPTPVSTPAPSSTSTIQSEKLCSLVNLLVEKSGKRKADYIDRLFKEMSNENSTTIRKRRVIRQIKKIFARIEKLSDHELLLDNVESLINGTESDQSSSDQTDIDEELEDDASMVFSVKSEIVLKHPLREKKEIDNSMKFADSDTESDDSYGGRFIDKQKRCSVSYRNKHLGSDASSSLATTSENYHFSKSPYANSLPTIDDDQEADKRRNQRIRRIEKIVKRKALKKFVDEENDQAGVRWFSSKIRQKFEEVVQVENNVRSTWWKNLENRMQCANELKKLREESAENCAARYLVFEKLVSYAETPENAKDEIGLESYFSREEVNRDFAQIIKERVLKKRFNFHMNIHQPEWETAEKEKKRKMKAKKLQQDIDQSEGAYYVESSDGDDDEQSGKKSFVFQNMRKMFIDELYTLLLLFEAQYQMVAVNVVRCIGYMNQLSNQFDFLAKELEEYDETAENRFRLRSSSSKPRNNLVHWFMHVYQLLLAKFSLYSADILGPSCLNPEDFSEFQTFDNGFNFIERCVDYCKKSHPYFLCICIGGRQKISEKDGDFETCMLLPDETMDFDDFRKEHNKLITTERNQQRVFNYEFQHRENLPLLKIIRKKHDLDHLDELPLEQTLKEIELLDLTENEKDFMLNNAKYGFLTPRDAPEEKTKIDKNPNSDPRFVPILFRLPSALNPDHNAEGMVPVDNQGPAFEMASKFVRNHFHTQALQYLGKMPRNRKAFRLYNYDKQINSSFFGEVIERNIYMVLVFRGKVRKWERRAFDFFGTILPELRCSSSFHLLSKAAHTPELGMIGRDMTISVDSDSS